MYLGLRLDPSLHWKPHIIEKVKKGKIFMQQLISISRSLWGPKPPIMKWIFTGMIRPMVSYAAVTGSHELNTNIVRNALKKLDRLALLSLAPVRPSTPTEGLRIIYDLIPTELWKKNLY